MPNNMSEFEDVDRELNPETDLDPLTDSRTVAQTPTEDGQIQKLPESREGERAGDFDTTTGAAHPVEDSGSDKGVSKN